MDRAAFIDFAGRSAGSSAPGRLLLELPGLLEAGLAHEPGAARTFETSVDSTSPGRLKLLHLHAYPETVAPSRRGALERAKGEAYAGALRRMNAESGSAFDAAGLETLLGELGRGGDWECSKFGAEFDPAAGAFEKATHYFLVRGPSRLARLCAAAGLALSPEAAALAGEDLDCLGVDYLPGGGRALKVYRRLDPSHPDARPGRAFREGLAGLPLLPWTGALVRLGADGRALPRSKSFFRLAEGVEAEALLRLEVLAPHRGFLAGLAARSRGLRVRHLAFQAGGLEVYLRRDG